MAKTLKSGLGKTRHTLKNRLSRWLGWSGKLDDDFWEDWEEALIEVDLGVETTLELLDRVREGIRNKKEATAAKVKERLGEELVSILGSNAGSLPEKSKVRDKPVVIMVVGVNGTGKTTTIAKLAKKFSDNGSRVMLAACDTFRAAAIEQLEIWGKRLKVEVISQQYGGDPAAVAFDALKAATARQCDYLIIDTAGRLHTRTTLMDELGKIVRVLRKLDHGVPDEVYLCLDATFGRNGVVQAAKFAEVLPLTGVLLTKLDGTARGGMVVSIRKELGIPVVALGVGEDASDLIEFAPGDFVDGLLGNGEGSA